MRTKIIALTAAAAVSGAVAVPAYAATKSIKVGDNYFYKKGKIRTLSVKKGTTLKFKWNTQAPHNVVATGANKGSSGAIKKTGSFSLKLKKAGSTTILCTVHPDMKLKLKVK